MKNIHTKNIKFFEKEIPENFQDLKDFNHFLEKYNIKYDEILNSYYKIIVEQKKEVCENETDYWLLFLLETNKRVSHILNFIDLKYISKFEILENFLQKINPLYFYEIKNYLKNKNDFTLKLSIENNLLNHNLEIQLSKENPENLTKKLKYVLKIFQNIPDSTCHIQVK